MLHKRSLQSVTVPVLRPPSFPGSSNSSPERCWLLGRHARFGRTLGNGVARLLLLAPPVMIPGVPAFDSHS